MVGMFRTLSPGDSISIALRKLLRGGRKGRQDIYKFATKGVGSLNTKDQVEVKEFSILCMGRCKPLGSLNSFPSYALQLPGAKSCFLVHLASCIPQFLSNHCGRGGICWIAVLGARIHIWRPEMADGCDMSCLLIWQETFSFLTTKPARAIG